MKPRLCLFVLIFFFLAAPGWAQDQVQPPQEPTVSALDGYTRLGSGPRGELSLVNAEGKAIPLPPTVVFYGYHGEPLPADASILLGRSVDVILFSPEEMRTIDHEKNPFGIRAVRLLFE